MLIDGRRIRRFAAAAAPAVVIVSREVVGHVGGIPAVGVVRHVEWNVIHWRRTKNKHLMAINSGENE